jgi:hypothetical protein
MPQLPLGQSAGVVQGWPLHRPWSESELTRAHMRGAQHGGPDGQPGMSPVSHEPPHPLHVGGVLVVVVTVVVVVVVVVVDGVQQKPTSAGDSCTSSGLHASRTLTAPCGVPLRDSLVHSTAA